MELVIGSHTTTNSQEGAVGGGEVWLIQTSAVGEAWLCNWLLKMRVKAAERFPPSSLFDHRETSSVMNHGFKQTLHAV